MQYEFCTEIKTWCVCVRLVDLCCVRCSRGARSLSGGACDCFRLTWRQPDNLQPELRSGQRCPCCGAQGWHQLSALRGCGGNDRSNFGQFRIIDSTECGGSQRAKLSVPLDGSRYDSVQLRRQECQVQAISSQ